ncbi:MAG: hypothetical protein JWM36_1162 [Hyphomicrobiales bacterium]|nr:hypothetical protein [Hyphomicrobiales bacterium]
MSLTAREVANLRKILSLAEGLLSKADQPNGRKDGRKKSVAATNVRSRRSGKDLISFRKTLLAERKSKVPVAEIARKHGISKAYIYQLK